MRLHFKYKKYPLSEELTKKSMRVGTLTHPLYGIIFGAIPGVLSAFLLPSSVEIPLFLLFAGAVGGPILLSVVRKKLFAKYDAEYEQLLKSQGR
jgi:uncharacterized membrane protein YeaQ/YmgE (transglycosylase-associated protein family)